MPTTHNLIGPESLIKSTTGSLLRSYPQLSLTQLHQWLDEAYCQWRDRELGPERYDPLEDPPDLPMEGSSGVGSPGLDSPAGIDWNLI